MSIQNTHIQEQINEINLKLDLVIDYVKEQKLRSDRMNDLVTDVSIIGNDAWHSLVRELDNQGIELDAEEVKLMIFRIIKNIRNFNQMLLAIESVSDLMKDTGPIVREVSIDLIHKLHELEQKGYFKFFREAGTIIDKIITHYSVDELRALGDNIVTILDTLKNLTQPEMLQAMNNAILIYKNLDPKEIKEYSLWKAFREMNTPEMRRGIGFMMAFLKSLAKAENKSIN